MNDLVVVGASFTLRVVRTRHGVALPEEEIRSPVPLLDEAGERIAARDHVIAAADQAEEKLEEFRQQWKAAEVPDPAPNRAERRRAARKKP